MILFGDRAQNIYHKHFVSEKEEHKLILSNFGKWYNLQSPSMRIRGGILATLLNNFIEQYLASKYDKLKKFLFNIGDEKRLLNYTDKNVYVYKNIHSLNEIFDRILYYIHDLNMSPNDICILSSRLDILRYIKQSFDKIEKTMFAFADLNDLKKIDEASKTNNWNVKEIEMAKYQVQRLRKRYFNINSGLIKISTIHSFKGMECENIFYILTESDTDEIIYCSMTRSKNNLFIFNYNDSAHKNFFESYDKKMDIYKHDFVAKTGSRKSSE